MAYVTMFAIVYISITALDMLILLAYYRLGK